MSESKKVTRETAYEIILKDLYLYPGPLMYPYPTPEELEEDKRYISKLTREILDDPDPEIPGIFLGLLLNPPDLSYETFDEEDYFHAVYDWLEDLTICGRPEPYIILTRNILQRIEEDVTSWDPLIRVIENSRRFLYKPWVEAILRASEKRGIPLTEKQQALLDASFAEMEAGRSYTEEHMRPWLDGACMVEAEFLANRGGEAYNVAA